MSEIVRYVERARTGGVRVNLARTTTGTTCEIQIDRPREDGESWEDAELDAARIARRALAAVQQELSELGLTLGKDSPK